MTIKKVKRSKSGRGSVSKAFSRMRKRERDKEKKKSIKNDFKNI